MSKDIITASTSGFAREVGGAHSTPGAPPPTPATPPRPLPEMTVGSRTLDRRLNPNAPVFVPDFKASQVAKNLFDELSPYTRWSTASSEDISFGPRYESIWREVSLQKLHQRLPNPRFDYSLDPGEDEVGELEFDQHQAMNIGAESYDPIAGSTTISQAMEVPKIVGDAVPPQLEESLDEGKCSGFQNRLSSRSTRGCCLLM
ncbi:uncharacterized protein LOC108047307 [Drosophila rhopaloa]|uniref:Uncharacterized protein LOC108047307 n=1 Tax=Drosophila rhopaloa TaxID=1041015 RepID=A0A6P4EXR6_DRORH|nr:uncharacterized protein LOC108047307 [Drosophila rhopaloa]